MPSEFEFRPGDTDNNILRKILGQSGVVGPGVAAVVDAIVDTAATTASLLLASNATIAAVAADTALGTSATEPLFQAARNGLLDGQQAMAYNVSGRRQGFDQANTSNDVGEFLGTSVRRFPELTGVEVLELVSSSAQDANPAGTGVRTVRVTYIDNSNNLAQSPLILLNGLTPVAAGFTANAILWIEAASGGTPEGAAGNIILRIVGPGATQEQVSIGENRSLSARFFVPTGFTAFIPRWQTMAFGGASQDCRLRGTASLFDRALSTQYITQDLALTESGQTLNNEFPWLLFPELSKIKVSSIPSAAGMANRIGTDFTVLLIAN